MYSGTEDALDRARAVSSRFEEDRRMARVRGRQKGHIRRIGPSWFLTYREYQQSEDGSWQDRKVTEFLGPRDLTLKEATKLAAPFLTRANQRAEKPSINMPVGVFIDQHFWPYLRRTMKPSGLKHYRYILNTFVVPALGLKQLCDVATIDVEAIITKADRKYSRQTQLHIKNAISAVFDRASKLDLYDRKNPAMAVEIGEVVPRKRATYNTEQLAAVLVRLPSPAFEMALLGAECSLGPAELCGVRIRHCNLTDAPMELDGIPVAPHSVAILENYYEGQRGTLKTGSRRRIVPFGEVMSERLRKLVTAAPDQSPEAPLFQSRAGTPVDTHNVTNRVFKRLSEELGFSVTWYGFRRAHSTLAALTGADLGDRKLVMGHAPDTKMTEYYDIKDVERLRNLTGRIEETLDEAVNKARSKVVPIRKTG